MKQTQNRQALAAEAEAVVGPLLEYLDTQLESLVDLADRTVFKRLLKVHFFLKIQFFSRFNFSLRFNFFIMNSFNLVVNWTLKQAANIKDWVVRVVDQGYPTKK